MKTRVTVQAIDKLIYIKIPDEPHGDEFRLTLTIAEATNFYFKLADALVEADNTIKDLVTFR